MAHQMTEEQTYWQSWVTSRDAQAGNFLVQKYLPLVSYHVQRISVNLPRNVSRDDLRSLGLMGLYDALEKFEPNRDLKFDTYASFRIRGAILDGLRKEDWLPRNTREKAKKIESAIEKLEQRLGRKATIQEISLEVNMTEEEVHSVMNEHFFANILSIDEKPSDQDDKESQSFIIKDEGTEMPEEKIIKDEMIAEMVQLISQLNEKEQLVISLFYKEELTLTEIGQVMNLSTSRISQIHSKAIFKLRHALEKVF
ncbi:FliA/WhiG family RNA polymerase sigma factor [Cytobacillus praedii]|uniref:FliA/WhiG family RNA polymerase sigma factor n=1 Tax=Cytobacillus praedii TaxID=1742358 RepID=A0A4R1AZR5_9BACI|nr:FliA/WhiG family RNA polymerase sigma factor [Cytobacillus praedii]MED3552166.1 FliA/WhiG family RNA polymerase sigma factor [Cytobacillus praedii]MED3573391.1 FliA/WhiG family RNA polymerase sigma factor [Cytobacillus praedii]TCJ05964.1 FliA/WhiG family RNA polymerase sigma factor [Cytobacillus praedii]